MLRAVGLLVILLGLAGGCRQGKQDHEPDRQPQPPAPLPDEAPEYPPIDPSSATPLDILYFPEPVGDGYERVPVRFGPSLHSGKWLGLANGDGVSLGPKHVIVNHFRSKPDFLGEGDLIKSVVLDVETGEEVLEFDHGRYVNSHWGLAFVFKKGDPRPYLLDVEFGDLVLAVPAGEHEYVIGENYWLRFSPIAKRVWISARDKKGIYHLYAWENLRAPPEQPNNPFPFAPEYWDPLDSSGFASTDHEELRAVGQPLLPCTRVILDPPKGYSCLDDEELEDTEPLSDGWRFDTPNGRLLNRKDGRTLDISPLCPEGERAFPDRVRRSPPTVKIVCEEDTSAWYLWTAPDRLQKMDPEFARRLNDSELFLLPHPNIDRYELRDPSLPGIDSVLDYETLQREFIADDHECPDSMPRPGNSRFYADGCRLDSRRASWFELVDRKDKTRGLFHASEVVVTRSGIAVGIVRRNGRDHVVRITLTASGR